MIVMKRLIHKFFICSPKGFILDLVQYMCILYCKFCALVSIHRPAVHDMFPLERSQGEVRKTVEPEVHVCTYINLRP